MWVQFLDIINKAGIGFDIYLPRFFFFILKNFGPKILRTYNKYMFNLKGLPGKYLEIRKQQTKNIYTAKPGSQEE